MFAFTPKEHVTTYSMLTWLCLQSTVRAVSCTSAITLTWFIYYWWADCSSCLHGRIPTRASYKIIWSLVMTFILPAENVLSMHALAAAASFLFSTHSQQSHPLQQCFAQGYIGSSSLNGKIVTHWSVWGISRHHAPWWCILQRVMSTPTPDDKRWYFGYLWEATDEEKVTMCLERPDCEGHIRVKTRLVSSCQFRSSLASCESHPNPFAPHPPWQKPLTTHSSQS